MPTGSREIPICQWTHTVMQRGDRWGGGIELAAFVLSQNVSVHVFERRRTELFRIAHYPAPSSSDTAVHVLYVGSSHYDLLTGGHLETAVEAPEATSNSTLSVSTAEDDQNDLPQATARSRYLTQRTTRATCLRAPKPQATARTRYLTQRTTRATSPRSCARLTSQVTFGRSGS